MHLFLTFYMPNKFIGLELALAWNIRTFASNLLSNHSNSTRYDDQILP